MAETLPQAIKPAQATAPEASNLVLSPDTTNLEEGKALYENGQLIAALGKFMGVLRNDPHNPEARQYLRLIVDTMRQNPAISSSKVGGQQAVATNPVVEEEIRRMLQLRSRLSLDLKAIPSLQMDVNGNVNQVKIDSTLLFAEKSGGLKEGGVPVLDRVAAWLKTFGQQPVIIHCYPEELQDPSINDSLFLHRYSELFNFFVEEKKLAPQRFVSADLLGSSPPNAAVGGPSSKDMMGSQPETAGNDGNKVVIETIGTQTAMLEAMPSITSSKGLSQWLENAIIPSRKMFNPEEGEWVSLDLAALTRAGLRSWSFTIQAAEGKKTAPVLRLDGKGNLLRRVSWDGHDQRGGSFVDAGNYLAKLVAVNSDGTIKSQEEILQVARNTKPEPAAIVEKPKPQPKPKAKPKPPATQQGGRAPEVWRSKPKPVQVAQAAPAETSSPAAPSGGSMDSPLKAGGNDTKVPTTADSDSDSLIDTKPAAQTSEPAAQASSPAAEAAPVVEDNTDAAHTIWKQVIRFDANQSQLVPTVKSSLERIGKTLEVYPLQKVRIMGFAAASEQNAQELAKKRADQVRTILVNEYHVDAKRVIVAGGRISAEEVASKVEMSITN